MVSRTSNPRSTRCASGPGYAAVVAMADRELQFAALMEDEIVRLQAGETTGV
jgi:hypothetical protein